MVRKRLIYAAFLALILAACSTPRTPPAAPTGLTATPGARSVEVSWDANAEMDLVSYNVYSGRTGGLLSPVATVPAGTESLLIEDLFGFQEYSFAVTAESPGGESSLSAAAAAIPLQTAFYQPGFFTMRTDPANYLQAEYSPDLNPTTALTIEGWVRTHTSSVTCASLIGNGYTEGFWVGICDDTLRTYTRGGGSSFEGGSVPPQTWVHFAVTTDGETRRHYIDGALAAETPESGPPTGSPNPVTIGTDLQWTDQLVADLRELRIWSVARTEAQILATMNQSLTSPQAGLEAVWPLAWDGRDELGTHHAAPVGFPLFGPQSETDEDDPSMPVAIISGGLCSGGYGVVDVRYQVMPFYVAEDGTYAFSSYNEPNLVAFYIMDESFDPADPVASCLAAQNAGNPSYVTANLTAGDYLAVVIDDTFAQDQVLEFTISIAGPL